MLQTLEANTLRLVSVCARMDDEANDDQPGRFKKASDLRVVAATLCWWKF